MKRRSTAISCCCPWAHSPVHRCRPSRSRSTAGRCSKVDLPLAFGSIPVVGYLPVYDLTGHQGKSLKVSFHSYMGYDPAQPSIKPLIQREMPGRVAAGDRPAFHIHNRIGMLNDPNGLVYVDGVYHVFHQYNYNITAARGHTMPAPISCIGRNARLGCGTT